MTYTYEIVLYWSNADGAFVAEVPELPGCMAHGDTQEAERLVVADASPLIGSSGTPSGCPLSLGCLTSV